MKKNSTFLNRFTKITFLIILVLTNSCKKGYKDQFLTNTSALNAIEESSKIRSSEIIAWLQTFPEDYKSSLLLEKAQYRVINKKQVVKIPIRKDAALFFIKDEGKLKVWAYRWFDKKPGNKDYTGSVFSYSLEDNKAYQLIYEQGSLISSNILENKGFVKNSGDSTKRVMSEGDNGSFLGRLWCFITGGTYYDGVTGSPGSHGEVGRPGCNRDVDETPGDGTIPSGLVITIGAPPVFNSGSGGGGASGAGGGAVWISNWAPGQSDPGCDVNANGGSNLGSGQSGSGPSADCAPDDGHWNSYQLNFTDYYNSLDYDGLDPNTLGSVQNDEDGKFIYFDQTTNEFKTIDRNSSDYNNWYNAYSNPNLPANPTPLTSDLLRQLGRGHGWDQGVSLVEFNRRVGKAFQEAALRSLFNTATLAKQYEKESSYRKLITNNSVSNVRPDFVGPVFDTENGIIKTYLNQAYFEVKAVTGTIYPSNSQYQLVGMIDALANNRIAGKKFNPALFLITVENTVISQGVRNYAARRGVELWQTKAQIDPTDGMIFFGPAYHLNGKFSLPLQLTTRKVHLDPAQYTDIGPDYESLEE